MQPLSSRETQILEQLRTLLGPDALKLYDEHDRSLHALVTHARESDSPRYRTLRAGIAIAIETLHEELRTRPALTSPDAVRQALTLTFAGQSYESFLVLFLDAQHRLIASEELFRGTLTQTSVYPREIVKRALARNSAAVVLAHNHPSGSLEPSLADTRLTEAIKKALALVDIRVLDHLVVAGTGAMSFAERGLL
ncbi:MAG: DNA repair protein RadC [Myxococcota bacterium]|jgi:DNA repair protein RadC|nr:DNA repair protein RadC [Myxococcota bacterium]MCU0895973.1 DNA repair protein RadC [Burkholderiales bacterium]